MAIYQIRVRGHLDPKRSAWFGGLTVTHTTNGDTILVGPVEDEAALHGLLMKVRDLHLPLIAVSRVDAGQDGGGVQPAGG